MFQGWAIAARHNETPHTLTVVVVGGGGDGGGGVALAAAAAVVAVVVVVGVVVVVLLLLVLAAVAASAAEVVAFAGGYVAVVGGLDRVVDDSSTAILGTVFVAGSVGVGSDWWCGRRWDQTKQASCMQACCKHKEQGDQQLELKAAKPLRWHQL